MLGYTVEGARREADQIWSLRVLSPQNRHTLTDRVVDVFWAEIQKDPKSKPRLANVKREVLHDPGVKQFIPLPFILMPLIGWAIGKLLDWLWDQYVSQMENL